MSLGWAMSLLGLTNDPPNYIAPPPILELIPGGPLPTQRKNPPSRTTVIHYSPICHKVFIVMSAIIAVSPRPHSSRFALYSPRLSTGYSPFFSLWPRGRPYKRKKTGKKIARGRTKKGRQWLQTTILNSAWECMIIFCRSIQGNCCGTLIDNCLILC